MKATKPAPRRPASSARNVNRRVKPLNFKRYIYKVLMQVHPGTAITEHSMQVLDDFLNETLKIVTNEAIILTDHNNKVTLSSREMQSAVRLLIPGELAKHAVSEGTKAVTKFTSSKCY